MSQEVTRMLARWIVGSRLADIPADVRKSGVASFLNWMGCAVGGSRHETLDRAIAALAPFAGPGQATILGRREHFDVMHAALLNGISSHVFDFDDTHLKTIIHPAGPIASAVLAMAEYQPLSGAELLHAFIIGVEVECRIGNAVYPAHYDIGWHITGTAGVFGAAAAVGKMLNLDEQQMTWALGIAGTQSAGFREMFGTMCKSFHPGRAAQNGIASALLAKQNFTSSNRVLEAPRGFAHVMSVARDFDEITRDLGTVWETALNSYKPFACGIVIHPSIDGCIQLRNEHGLNAEDIAKIDLIVDPLVLELTGKKTPQTGLEGKFSVYHSCAAAIIYGAAGENEYGDDTVRDPRVMTLRDKVEAVAKEDINEDEAYLTITLNDGRVLKKHVEHAIGSIAKPMTRDQLIAKFDSLVRDVLPVDRADALRELCWKMEDLTDGGDLARAAAAL